MAILYH